MKKELDLENDFTNGQECLINDIKNKITVILETTKGTDILLDIVHLLKNLKPIENENNTNTKRT